MVEEEKSGDKVLEKTHYLGVVRRTFRWRGFFPKPTFLFRGWVKSMGPIYVYVQGSSRGQRSWTRWQNF